MHGANAYSLCISVPRNGPEISDQQNNFSVHSDVESAVVDVSDNEVLYNGDQQTRTHHLSLWLKKKLKSLYSAVIRSLKDLVTFMR